MLLPGDRMLTFSDRADTLEFALPRGTGIAGYRFGKVPVNPYDRRFGRDIESATRDPASGTIWLGWEWSNTISRHGADLVRTGMAGPGAMRHWSQNTGPEAVVRLADGRFIVLSEAFTHWLHWKEHRALLFVRDPAKGGKPQGFSFEGSDGFRPTDMAQLPDGRVLVLMRQMTWPLPIRFSGRIVIADPAEIRPGGIWRGRELAKLEPPLPIDNFEGMAIRPLSDGQVEV